MKNFIGFQGQELEKHGLSHQKLFFCLCTDYISFAYLSEIILKTVDKLQTIIYISHFLMYLKLFLQFLLVSGLSFMYIVLAQFVNNTPTVVNIELQLHICTAVITGSCFGLIRLNVSRSCKIVFQCMSMKVSV